MAYTDGSHYVCAYIDCVRIEGNGSADGFKINSIAVHPRTTRGYPFKMDVRSNSVPSLVGQRTAINLEIPGYRPFITGAVCKDYSQTSHCSYLAVVHVRWLTGMVV